MRGRFFWRMAAFMGFFLFLVACGIALLFWLASMKFGGPPPFQGPPPFFRPFGFLFMLLLIFGVVSAVRALRGTTAPVGDVMEAAGQVADGNYTVRVVERGPPEVQALAQAFNKMAARLQAHEEQRRNLLADVTHELRTPLAVMQGNLEGVLDGVYPRDDAHLTPILDEARVLSSLIEDLRTLALAETGTLQLQREPTDLGALIDDTVASFRPQAETAGVTLRTERLTDVPVLEIDPTRIRQVLANLLHNALRHTAPGGSVIVACSADAEGDRTTTVSVSISDTGRGIAPTDLPHIFDRFFKSRESRGSGLGLTIVKNLVMAHGGDVSASSEIGSGTTIRFTLPISV